MDSLYNLLFHDPGGPSWEVGLSCPLDQLMTQKRMKTISL